jgi:predicted dehydrogenase
MPDTTTFRWGLIGPGNIAHAFAGGLSAVPGGCLHAVLARDAAKGRAFAERWPQPQAVRVITELAELLADPALDAVYIATPHSQHGEFARAALLAGKAVLCEKPLVPTLAEAQALVALARERGVFLMEALWTRFLPAYEQAGAWLRAGHLGELRGMQSSFCFAAPDDPTSRLWNPALAGGSLLDVGIYNLGVTRWVLEQLHGTCPEPEHIDARARWAPTGVDAAITATLHFPGGVASQFRCGFDGAAVNAFEIIGSRATLRFPHGFSAASSFEHGPSWRQPTRVEAPFGFNGFEGEIAEAQACIRAGLTESPRMPHAESLALARWMDVILQKARAA